jgi:hypothetical protein
VLPCDNLRNAGAIRGRNRNASGNGLERRITETLRQARNDGAVGVMDYVHQSCGWKAIDDKDPSSRAALQFAASVSIFGASLSISNKRALGTAA